MKYEGDHVVPELQEIFHIIAKYDLVLSICHHTTRERFIILDDALETGEFESGELAPRIKALSQKKEELQQLNAEAEEMMRYEGVEIADPQVVQGYADDLRGLLMKSSITEQRGFLKSFIERIEVIDTKAKIYYTIPMPPHSTSEETVGVLPFVYHG